MRIGSGEFNARILETEEVSGQPVIQVLTEVISQRASGSVYSHLECSPEEAKTLGTWLFNVGLKAEERQQSLSRSGSREREFASTSSGRSSSERSSGERRGMETPPVDQSSR